MRGLTVSLISALVLALVASLGGGWGEALGQTAGPPPSLQNSGAPSAPGDGVVPPPATDYRPTQPRVVAPPQPPAGQTGAALSPTATTLPPTYTPSPTPTASQTPQLSITATPKPAATSTALPAATPTLQKPSDSALLEGLGGLPAAVIAGCIVGVVALVGTWWFRRPRQ